MTRSVKGIAKSRNEEEEEEEEEEEVYLQSGLLWRGDSALGSTGELQGALGCSREHWGALGADFAAWRTILVRLELTCSNDANLQPDAKLLCCVLELLTC